MSIFPSGVYVVDIGSGSDAGCRISDAGGRGDWKYGGWRQPSPPIR